jgi:general secretion pathway protein G
MKKGFTMIELIFVIVILGILAAVAIPKLAATRDDAKAASIKTDIGTAIQAVPSWFQGQKEASFINAMSLDTNVWAKQNNQCSYVYTDGAGDTVTMSIYARTVEANGTVTSGPTLLTACEETNASVLGNSPFLSIALDATNGNDIVDVLKNDLGVNDANISLAGRKVKW